MDNDWIDHKGGPMPVGAHKLVEYRLRGSEKESTTFATNLQWLHRNGDPSQDLVAFRVLPEFEPAAVGTVWLEYRGGLCPVEAGVTVDVIRADRREVRGVASDFRWGNDQKDTHRVTHYRKAAPVEQSSGGDNDYWIADIVNPKRLPPCRVECEDVIQALGMTFGEGEAFKAIWRGCAARKGNGKPGDTALRNAEKVVHYGEYMKRDC